MRRRSMSVYAPLNLLQLLADLDPMLILPELALLAITALQSEALAERAQALQVKHTSFSAKQSCLCVEC